MADFTFDEYAIPNLIKQLEGANVYDDQIAQEMLFAGAEVLSAEIKEHMARAGNFNSDNISKNVGFTRRVNKGKNGVRSVTITVKGKDKNGVPNAAKAFVFNYGRQKRYGAIVGSHYWNRARQKAEPEMIKKCEEIATNKLRQKGLI